MGREKYARPDRRPEVVTGDGMVGVTWAPGAEVAEEDLSIAARTLTDGEWSGWSALEYHDEHAPDPDTRDLGGYPPPMVDHKEERQEALDRWEKIRG